MANAEHLAILKKGVQEWNAWVQPAYGGRPSARIRPDLRNLDASFLKEFDFYKFIENDYPAPGEINELFQDYKAGKLNQQQLKLGWKSLDNINLEYADLSGADLSGISLKNANLSRANLTNANLSSADLSNSTISGANFTGADLTGANLSFAFLYESRFEKAKMNNSILRYAALARCSFKEVNLSCANLVGANLTSARIETTILVSADLTSANLTLALLFNTDLRKANLEQAVFVETQLQNSNLSECRVYGLSAWNLKTTDTIQKNLVITPQHEASITVDDLEIAQFIYLLINNENIRTAIDTITSKVVLILGRFTIKRKNVLDKLRSELRLRNYLPVLFDFDKPKSRNLTETISTIAHLAKFIIADLTDAKSIPQELERIIPGLPHVPVQPIILKSQKEYAMFEHYKYYPWVLELYLYENSKELLACISSKIIGPAEEKVTEQASK
jgi:uncharacterized protein YjbI with pentapeptide repeats